MPSETAGTRIKTAIEASQTRLGDAAGADSTSGFRRRDQAAGGFSLGAFRIFRRDQALRFVPLDFGDLSLIKRDADVPPRATPRGALASGQSTLITAAAVKTAKINHNMEP